MRYADSSYLCNTVYYTVAYSPISTKIQLPQDFVITQFKPFILQQGFIGSFQGVGMYGIAYSTFSPLLKKQRILSNVLSTKRYTLQLKSQVLHFMDRRNVV